MTQDVETRPYPTGWWLGARQFSMVELVADGVVNIIGLLTAAVLGTILLVFAFTGTALAEIPALIVYLATLFLVLSISLAYNLWSPHSPHKHIWARLDQAAIFLFIAGTYTPLLAVLGDTPVASMLTVFVWATAIVGIALKLIVPERFGKLAIMLYLAIGWSGVLAFQTLASSLPAATLWLLVAGGVTYSLGIIFHLWDKLLFQNVLWHVFVVAGATLHLVAILHCMVISRL